MSALKMTGQIMMAGARAHAKWEKEMSDRILGDRKRLIILGLLLLPIILGGVAWADELVAALPSILGGKMAYSPAYYTSTIFFASIGVGLGAGLITGCIGAGGGFIIAPALMSAGVKGIMAVGTDLFHIFAKAIMGSVLHRKLGNISVPLALTFLIGAIAGATAGGLINRTLYELNPVLSDAFITTVYVFMLGFLGFYSLADFLSSRKSRKITSGAEGAVGADGAVVAPGEVVPEKESMTALSEKLQSINIPPMVHFDQGVVPGGRKISAIFLVIAGAFVGLAAAIMGVGGGFLTFPIFVYILGVSSSTTVGTDIFQIIFTAGYAGLGQYAIYGFIFYTLAMGMLLGSLIGIQIGSVVTKVVPGTTIRGFYAVAVLSGFVNRAFALPSKLAALGYLDITARTGYILEQIGIYLFFVVITIFSVWVIGTFVVNIKHLKVGHATPSNQA